MARQMKLVNKLSRREKDMHMNQRGAYDRRNKLEEIMQKSLKVLKLLRKPQRRMDRNFGIDAVGKEPMLAYDFKAATLERFDYDAGAPTDYGMRITFSSSAIREASGVAVGDIVEIREGSLKGVHLKVVAVTDSTHIRMEDVASFGSAENNVDCRMHNSDVKRSYN